MNMVALLFCFGISFVSVAVISFSAGLYAGYKDGYKDILEVLGAEMVDIPKKDDD